MIEYGSNTRSNIGVGRFSLPERASNSTAKNFGFQFRDTAVLSARFVHEARLEITGQHNTSNPVSQARAINVLDAFSAGGSQNVSDTTNKSFLFGNALIFNTKKLTLKTGLQGDYYRNPPTTRTIFSARTHSPRWIRTLQASPLRSR